jgi:hypothetical protein
MSLKLNTQEQFMLKRRLMVVLLFFVLSGCSAQPPVTLSPTAQPTLAASRTAASVSPALTATLPPTEMISPTNQTIMVAPTAKAKTYTGTIYPPLPEDVTISSGMMISPDVYLDWAIEIVKGHEYMLWFSKSISRTSQGKAIFQVSDAMVIEHQEKDDVILVSACLLAGRLDAEIVALAKLDQQSLENRFLHNKSIIATWRANRSTGKFETLNKDNIECYAETFLGFQ